jgi:peptide/nickel transport system substrate-binding protein
MQSVTTSVRTSLSRRPSLRSATIARSLSILASLLLACAPPAQPAATNGPAPAAAPAAKPAEPAAKPAEPAAKPAEPAAQGAPSPAAASGQASAKPADPAQGKIVIVFEAEPNTIVPKDSATNNGYIVLDNVYDHLTGRDYSSGQPRIVPQLADSWSRVDDRTWRFKLHQGVKFTNGEVFTADAVVVAVEDMANPQKRGLAADEYGTLQSARKIDDFSVEIVSKDPDPILPDRMVKFPIAAPQWVRTASAEAAATQAVGSGPYLLAEYQKGQYLLFKANPDYWGPNKPRIAEIKLVGRNEQAVRAAMLLAGEADLAFHIALDDAKKAPQTIIEQSQESPMFNVNTELPVFKDIRVRQAVAEAVDVPGMINALYPGGVAVPLNGQIVRQGTLGWNPNLKPYPYKPDEAKRLMQEAGAVGTAVEYYDRPGSFPRAAEVSELIVNQLNQIGFKASLRHLESAAFVEKHRAIKPEQNPADLLMTSVSSPILDASRPFDIYYACGGRYRITCDPEFDRRYAEAKGLTGEARDKAFQALQEYAYDKYWYMPLFGLNWVHGAAARLQWTPRTDSGVRFWEMSLKP